MRGRDYVKFLIKNMGDILKENRTMSIEGVKLQIELFDFKVRLGQLAEDYGVDLPFKEADFE